MLSFENVHITQGDFRLSADVSIGTRITALIGPSGAGKSTLLNAIAGFVTPQSGRIMWNETDITPLAPAKRPVAMLFQDNNLFPHLSILQNLSLALSKTRPGKEEREKVAQALESVGLAGVEGRKPGALSGGQQSRAALARALLQTRPLLLLDEPFAALGPALKTEMLDLVAQVAHEQDLHVIMVTHDPQDALHIADQTVLVAENTVTEPAATKPLLAYPPEALRRYLGPGFFGAPDG